MMKKLVLVLYVVALGCHAASGQNDTRANVYGVVSQKITDDFGGNKNEFTHPLVSANVRLVTEKSDTLYATTNSQGVFSFRNLEPQTILLNIFLVGKKSVSGRYAIESGRNVFYFMMEDAPERLDGAAVTAEIPLSKQVGDTTIFNAAAVSTKNADNARAILEQLPGFQVGQNKITVDGEVVKRTYVNGVLIFGDNTMTALNALKAEDVSKVLVYDEIAPADRHRGLKHAQRQKVLDIKTKEKFMSLANAAVVAGGGVDGDGGTGRWLGAGGAAFWSEMFGISALVSANNVGSAIDCDNMDGSSPSEIVLATQRLSALSSYDENVSATASVSKYWKDRLYGNGLKASYSFGNDWHKSMNRALTEYYRSDENPAMTYFDTSSVSSLSRKHSFEISSILNDTPLKSIDLSLNGNVSKSRSDGIEAQRIMSETEMIRHENNGSDVRNYGVGARLGWTHNDLEKIRPSFELEADFHDNKDVSWNVDTLKSSYNRRLLSADGFGRGISTSAGLSLEWMLINNDEHSLSFVGTLTSGYIHSRSRNMAIDNIDSSNPFIDYGSTYDYTWNVLNNSVAFSGSYLRNGLAIAANVEVKDTYRKDNETLPESGVSNRHFFSVLPLLSIKYKHFSMTLHTSSEIPSLEQSRSRISNANPLVLIGGNPQLQQEYGLSGKVAYSTPLGTKRKMNLIAILDGQCHFNSIVSATRYFDSETVLPEYSNYIVPAGAILNTFSNASVPAWQIEGSVHVSGAIVTNKLTLSANATGHYKERPQYSGNAIVGLAEGFAMLSANMRYTAIRKKLFFNLSPKIHYGKSFSDSSETISEWLSFSAGFSADYIFLKKGRLCINNDIFYNLHLSGFGQNVLTDRLNAYVEWRMLKNSLTLRFGGYDLLNSSAKYVTKATAIYNRQSWTPSWGRYFMFTVAYDFRKKK